MTQSRPIDRLLDTLCPMHIGLDADGRVIHAGPTLKKLRPSTQLAGQAFLDLFEIKRPRSIQGIEDLRKSVGTKLHLQFRKAPHTEFKGVVAPGMLPGECVVNLSFGIALVDGVRDHALNSGDFAATDLTVEMLYIVEAKSAAMEASRKLNLRLQGAMIAAEEQAFTDTLTGAKNRRAMDHVLKRYVDWGTEFAVMNIDLDWFKAVNDTYGHAAGDHVLQTVARIMVEETRESDTIVRAGGDEFVVILPNTTNAETIEIMGQRLIERISVPIPFQGNDCRISASIGVSFFEPEKLDTGLEQMLDDADVALYASKHAGRGCMTIYHPSLRDNPENTSAPVGRDVRSA